MKKRTMLKCSDADSFVRQGRNRMLKELKLALQLHYRNLEYSWENEYYGDDEAFYEYAPVITVVPPETSEPCNIRVAKVWLDQNLEINVSGYMVNDLPAEVSIKGDHLDPCDIQWMIVNIPATNEGCDMSEYSTDYPVFEKDYIETLQEMTVNLLPILEVASGMSHTAAFSWARGWTEVFIEQNHDTDWNKTSLTDEVKKFIARRVKVKF